MNRAAACWISLLMVASTLGFPAGAHGDDAGLREELAYTTGLDAYFFGYSSVALYRVMWRQALDPKAGKNDRINVFLHDRKVAGPDDKLIPAPNNDTLYSRAWFDLTTEPLVLEFPPIENRFYALPVADFYHNIVETIGSWNFGERGGAVLLADASWSGVEPPGVKVIRLQTRMGWILARTLTDGTRDDLKLVHRLQDQYRLVPLSEWQKSDGVQVFNRYAGYLQPSQEPLDFYRLLNDLLRRNAWRAGDEGMVNSFRAIGVHPSQRFDLEKLDAATQRGLQRALDMGAKILRERANARGRVVNGWREFPVTGDFGVNYLDRASSHFIGLQHGEQEMQAAYTAFVDADGEPLSGAHVYKVTFQPPPPVDGFWALTMYGLDYFLVANPIDRYSIGDRTPGLVRNADGSLTIWLQHDRPGEPNGGNWLPSPDSGFWVSIRAYLPQQELLRGDWTPPLIERMD